MLIISAHAYASEYRSEVTVGILYGKSAGQSFTVSSGGGVNVYNAQTGDVLYASQPGEEVYIQMGSTGFASTGKFDASGIAKISVQPQGAMTVFCAGKEYRGYIYAERRAERMIMCQVSSEKK